MSGLVPWSHLQDMHEMLTILHSSSVHIELVRSLMRCSNSWDTHGPVVGFPR